MAEENEGRHWPWQKEEPVPLAPAPVGVTQHAAAKAEKPEPKHEAKKAVAKHKAAHSHAASHGHAAKAEAKPERKTTVEITHITDAFGVVTVHGSVGEKQVQVKFQREDLQELPSIEAQGQYVAGQLKAVAEREHDPAEVPAQIDFRGSYRVPG